MNSILLSIIIPVYNVEDYLHECLDSIFEQDLRDCEVICVDDESTDNSWEILQKYQDQYSSILRIYKQSHGRQGAARNFGVKKARGEWIYFVDSDDYLTSEALPIIRQIIDSNISADVVHMDSILLSNGQRQFEFTNQENSTFTIKQYFLQHFVGVTKSPIIGPPNYLYKRNFWIEKKISYPENTSYEDRGLFYKLIMLDGMITVIHLLKPIYVYRVCREHSTTTNRSLQNFLDRQKIWRLAAEQFKEIKDNSTAYYHNLLQYAFFVLSEAGEFGLADQASIFYTKKDAEILRQGIISREERNRWLLARYFPKLAAMYLSNTCSIICRKNINRIFNILNLF